MVKVSIDAVAGNPSGEFIESATFNLQPSKYPFSFFVITF